MKKKYWKNVALGQGQKRWKLAEAVLLACE